VRPIEFKSDIYVFSLMLIILCLMEHLTCISFGHTLTPELLLLTLRIKFPSVFSHCDEAFRKFLSDSNEHQHLLHFFMAVGVTPCCRPRISSTHIRKNANIMLFTGLLCVSFVLE
jgi:hypothetical protein